MPRNLPYPETEDNLAKFKQFLMDYYKSSTFNKCDHQPLPLMDGPPIRLMVDPEAEPVAHHTPVPVPIHWKEEVKAGLDQDVRFGVLEPVPFGEPVIWCHRMVVCAKKNGKPRRTVDFQPINVHATRETHHTSSPFHQARLVPNGKRKTVFDAWNGYHSVPIPEEDRHLTTFITPSGRYRYKTAPQGYIASSDAYTRRYHEIVADIPNKTKCRITLVGSRFTHPAESRYAPVEGEALAVVDALDKARYFVLGCDDLIIAVDHKPLLKIFSDRSLEDISNSRLRNLKEKSLRYRFRMIHVPGVKHHAADGVSRHPTGDPEKLILSDDIAAIKKCTMSLPPATSFLSDIHHSDLESDATEIDNSVFTSAVSSLDSLAVRSVTWDRVRTATASDDSMNELYQLY
ncbi:unnamed protein product [Mytilus coruscus]|uniref:Reverse transcriptase RNase H-like domain-containing protein n=1 Tax=Mytilus coruscus TaxID=42192 RepID=A0A6J8C300_MYTCO|nr:unnamed protein product [Mytilus coruscus]